jgi:RNA polymerase sigma-70 factor (ECF subfamily)
VPNRQDEFERVAIPHSRSLLRVARRLARDRAVADDLVQETLLSAWRGFDRFQPGTNARAWLFRILLNAFYARGRRLRSGPLTVELDTAERAAHGAFSVASSQNEAAEITSALDKLSAEHRTVLLLAVVEGFTCQEVAGIIGLPIGTVMSRLSRARQALREKLSPPESSREALRANAACAAKQA